MHYLDDFLLLGQEDSDECGRALATSLHVCESLGMPVAYHKTEGPSTAIAFLGFCIDTERMVLSLPPTRLCIIPVEWCRQGIRFFGE